MQKIFKQIPNILTVIRFFLVFPLIFFAYQEDYIIAAIIFTISGITDVLDGIIARKFNLISDFGKLMDPLADKLNQISIIAVLTIKGIIPFWILGILLAKELSMILGASFLYEKNTVVSSSWYGKLATVILYIAVVLSLIGNALKIDFLIKYYIYLMYFAIFFTLFALIMYVQVFLSKKNEIKNSKKN